MSASRRERADKVLAVLVERHPLTFFPKDSPDTQPIMRGIYHLIRMRHADLKSYEVSCFLRIYTGKTRYLRALTTHPSRIDLDGKAVEPIKDSHREHAAAELAEREARNAQRQAA